MESLHLDPIGRFAPSRMTKGSDMYLQALRQIFKITFTILLFITLPVVLFTLVSSKVSVYGVKSYVVLSGSMEPTVPVGSIIYSLRLPSYQVGDVITFKQGNTTISHRVTKITNENGTTFYQTKGDANEEADGTLVPGSNVLGAKIYTIWNIGKLIIALKTIPGFVSLIVIPALFLIGFELWSIKKEFEKEIRKKVLQQIEQFNDAMNQRYDSA